MTTHFLIACSNKKSIPPGEGLFWTQETTIQIWSEAWAAPDGARLPAAEMYSGDSFAKQVGLITDHSEAHSIWIVSAGGGIISPSDRIPSYQSTFTSRQGPTFVEWCDLPHGGLSRLPLEDGDNVVMCLPEPYQRAVMLDVSWGIVSQKTLSIGPGPARQSCSEKLPCHPRFRELLNCGAMKIWTSLLEQYLSTDDPHEHFGEMVERASILPVHPMRELIDSQEEMDSIIQSLPGSVTSAGSAVRYIRDELHRSASQERISESWRRIRIEGVDEKR